MLNWAVWNFKIVRNGYKTYQVQGTAYYIIVFDGFDGFQWVPDDGIAVPLGPPWFLPPSWRRSWCNGVDMVILTVGGVVSNNSDVNQWEARGACGIQR